MKTSISNGPAAIVMGAILAASAASGVSAQELEAASSAQEREAAPGDPEITVYGTLPRDLSGLAEGPEIEGFISARNGNEIQVTSANGTPTTIQIADITDIKARGGFLGIGRTELGAEALINGLPVTVQTRQWEDTLLASQVRFSDNDLETATMIRTGTGQQFAEQGAAIQENTVATEALRGRMGDIDQYNIHGTTNVYFDTGKWELTPESRRELCAAASQAETTDNALLLVVGYTDAVGDQDYNQVLSERRAGRVVNFLQQECKWAPWRMLTPTGMAEADPTADNTTPQGRAQNRRVAVNILVSKAVAGM